MSEAALHLGWRLWWQDFRGRRIGMGDPPPKREFKDFSDLEAARREQRYLKLGGPDVITTITEIPMPVTKLRKQRKAQIVPLMDDLPEGQRAP